MKQFYVYIHKKPDGTPFYVGKGTGNRAYQFAKRTEWHKNIVAKYGKNNIIVEIINCINESQAFDLEKIYIKQFKINGVTLVNLTDGGEGTSGLIRGRPSDEHRRKNADAKRGKAQSEETKRKRSDALKGRKREFTKEHLQKIKEFNKTKIGNQNRKGKKHTEESKEKNRQAHLGKKQSKETIEKRKTTIRERKELITKIK